MNSVTIFSIACLGLGLYYGGFNGLIFAAIILAIGFGLHFAGVAMRSASPETQRKFAQGGNFAANAYRAGKAYNDRFDHEAEMNYLESMCMLPDDQLAYEMFRRFNVDQLRAFARGRNGASRTLQQMAQRAMYYRGLYF